MKTEDPPPVERPAEILTTTMVFCLNKQDGPLKWRKQESVNFTTEHRRDHFLVRPINFDRTPKDYSPKVFKNLLVRSNENRLTF